MNLWYPRFTKNQLLRMLPTIGYRLWEILDYINLFLAANNKGRTKCTSLQTEKRKGIDSDLKQFDEEDNY